MAPDTIVALSTSRGGAARAVVRLSGPEAVAIADALFSPAPGGGAPSMLTRGAVDGAIRMGRSRTETSARVLVMRGPRSFTGEDVAELHVPGAPLLVEVVQELCVREGARVAEAGEFTRRAFLSGRLDLTRAEAVLALIRARDDQDRRSALALLEGGVARRVAVIQDRILRALVPIELSLDFSDQDIEISTPPGIEDDLTRCEAELAALADGARDSSGERSCWRVVLEGPANAGKSSLFNRLLERDAALVTEVPGTTRDVLTGEIQIDGIRIELVDTAGDDVTVTAADEAAHRLRRQRLRDADLVLEVRDLRAYSGAREGASTPESHLRVWTHADVASSSSKPSDGVVVSNVTGDGQRALRAALATSLSRVCTRAASAPPLVTARQASAFRAAHCALQAARDAMSNARDAELIASDLREALHRLRCVTGTEVNDSVLTRVFSDFCVGK